MNLPPPPNAPPGVAPGEVLLSAEEAAPHFGVEADTVRKWIREGGIPVVRVGPHRRPRIKWSTILMFRTE